MIENWLDERLGLGSFWRAIFHRRVPAGLNWWYTLGAACLSVLILQAVTGILLAMNYVPSPERAYDSVSYITNVVPFGLIIRGLHHWGASAMVVLVILHMLSAFVFGAHKYPREATWLIGVLLFLITMGFGFTGYLLPWDQKAYWATTVGTNMPGTAPFIGSFLVKLLRGGIELGAVSLTRFYSIHVLVLPATIGLLALVHLALVIFHGVSVPPGLWHRGLRGIKAKHQNEEASAADIAKAMEPLPQGKQLSAHEHHDRYLAFKANGPRFWPQVIADDSKTMLVVFILLIGLTVVFGVPTEPRADQTDTSYIPRPEWYFMFLFEMLKFFPGNLEWVGALLVPGVAVVALFLAPFFGRERRAMRRPSLALVGAGLAGALFLSVQAYQATPPGVVVEHGVQLTSQQLRGEQIIAQEGCQSCHIINGEGDANKAPTLDGVGERMTAADIHFYMERPKSLNPASTMTPLVPPLTHEDVENVTQYLLTLPSQDAHLSKGEAGVQRANP